MHYFNVIDTCIGPVSTGVDAAGRVVWIHFGAVEAAPGLERDPARTAHVDAQLLEYFQGQRRSFELTLGANGTEFQRKVWELLVGIPYGETRSYGQLAAQLGNPGASRAVGRANATNPIAIVVPCHRVIGSSGALTGYAGGLSNKEKLLMLERGQPDGLFAIE